MIITAMNPAAAVIRGGHPKIQKLTGAAPAAAIELRETSRLAANTTAKTVIDTKVGVGAKARKTPHAVATPLPPSKRKNTE